MMTRLKSLLYIFILVLMYAIYYWGVPALINIDARMPIIQEKIKNDLGINFEMNNPELKMGLSPSVWISADNFVIEESDKSQPLKITKPKIKIRLLPMLLGKLNIAYFSSENLSADIKFDKKYRFYLGTYLFLDNSNPRITLENSKMDINGYKITLNDELQSKTIIFNGNYFKLSKFNSKKFIKLSMDSNIKVNNKTSVLDADLDLKLPFKNNFKEDNPYLNCTLTNLDLSNFSPYIKKFSNGQITKATGILDFEAKTKKVSKRTNRIFTRFVANNLSIINKNVYSSVIFPEKLNIDSVFETSRNVLSFEKLVLTSNNIDINLSGNISKISSKTPNLDLNINVNKSKIENIIKLIPAPKNNFEDINFVAMKKYGAFGDIKGSLDIKGEAAKPVIIGKILASNFYVIKELPPPIPKANFALIFSGTTMNMDIHVPVAIKESVTVSGPVELYDKKNADILVSSTKNLDLKTALFVLIPLHEIFQFELGPLPIMDLSGRGNILLKITGNKKAPHLFGAFNCQNATASFNELDLLLTDANGTFKFEDTDTHLIINSAKVNGKPVKVDGTCSLDGVLKYDVIAKNQDLGDLLSIVKNSPMLIDIQKVLSSVIGASGNSDITLKLVGNVKKLDEVAFGKTIFLNGIIKLYRNELNLEGIQIPLKNVSGEINFKNTDAVINLRTFISNSSIEIKGTIKNNIAGLKIKSSNLNIGDVLNCFKTNVHKSSLPRGFSNTLMSVNAEYKGAINKFDIKNFNLIGEILPNNLKKMQLSLDKGNIVLQNGTLKVSKINGSFDGNPFLLTATIANLMQKNQNINGYFESSNFDISTISKLTEYPFINGEFKKNLNSFSNILGRVDLRINAKNNNFNSKVDLKDISLVYTPLDIPLKIFSGELDFKNDKITAQTVNAQIESMPILIDGSVSNILNRPFFNVYLNSKPTQKFIDKYVNKKALYPLKIKGDIIYSSRITGTKELFSAKTEVNLEEDSSIYYMGGTLGDSIYPIRVFLDTTVSKKFIEVNNFKYDKLISSQNNKSYVTPQLTASGIISVSNEINLHNFKVKTQNPTDAKVFNVFFKKPVIKQGLFNSDIMLNGLISTPKIIGKLDFNGVDLPIFDTTIKDVSLDFDEDNVLINSTGEIFSNKIILTSKMKNKLTPPYEFKNIDIYCANLDINEITKSLNNIVMQDDKYRLSTPKLDFNLSNLVIESAKLKADNIRVKNIEAQNFQTNLSLSDKMILTLDDFKFDLANGKVSGDFKYNLLNSSSKLDLKADKVNANLVSEALFDLTSQIYGSLTGEVNLSCNGKSHKTCMETLSGKGGFIVEDGRMPKLGSLEYLLKASNLIKSGITGLSINGIIDLVSPLKTGQFESIRGDFTITSGLADSIQIFSKGKDLSLFITGTYNFATLIADLDVFGRLSKKISNALGPVGNVSLNTLFNTIPGLDLDDANRAQLIKSLDKIPGLELSEKMYRVFTVEIFGDINGDNYVKSFRWVE